MAANDATAMRAAREAVMRRRGRRIVFAAATSRSAAPDGRVSPDSVDRRDARAEAGEKLRGVVVPETLGAPDGDPARERDEEDAERGENETGCTDSAAPVWRVACRPAAGVKLGGTAAAGTARAAEAGLDVGGTAGGIADAGANDPGTCARCVSTARRGAASRRDTEGTKLGGT